MKKLIILDGFILNIGDKFISDSLRDYINKNFNVDTVIVKRNNYKKYLGDNSNQFIVPGGPWVMNDFSKNIFDFNKMIEDIHSNGQKIHFIGGGLSPKINIRKKIDDRTLNNLKIINSYSIFSTRSSRANKYLIENGLNSVMTGCSVWYSLLLAENCSNEDLLLISDPGFLNKKRTITTLISCLVLIIQVASLKKSNFRFFMFNRFINTFKDSPVLYLLQRIILIFLKLFNFEIYYANQLKNNLYDLISKFNLHIGYRVHSHLLFLSQGKKTFLFSEDIRGVGQNLTLNMNKNEKLIIESLKVRNLIKNENSYHWNDVENGKIVIQEKKNVFDLFMSNIINN